MYISLRNQLIAEHNGGNKAGEQPLGPVLLARHRDPRIVLIRERGSG